MEQEVFYRTMGVAFQKKQKPTNFLTSFFKPQLLDGIMAELQGQDVKATYSIDTPLGKGGRRHEFSFHEVKTVEVPEYNDFAELGESDIFKTDLGDTPYSIPAKTLLKKVALRHESLSDMQRRAQEKQAADAFFLGKITLSNGSKIEYRKKDTHSIAPTKKWNVSDSTPLKDIENACDLCVTDGKLCASEFHLITETSSYDALTNHKDFRENSNLNNNIKRSEILMPAQNSDGAVFHGRFAAGGYHINLWSYNAKYEIPTGFGFANEGTSTKYILKGGAILIPANPEYTCFYGALNDVNIKAPGLIGGVLNPQKAQQLPYAYDCVKNGSGLTIVGVKSRPLLYPTNVDSFATFKDVA